MTPDETTEPDAQYLDDFVPGAVYEYGPVTVSRLPYPLP